MLPRVYVVSLAAAVKRRARMYDRLTREDLPFTIVDAYTGTDLAVLEHAPNATPGHDQRVVACLLSHLRALHMFLKTPATEAIICEDDVRPRHAFEQHFAELRENIPDETPLVALSYLVWKWEGFSWSGKDHAKGNLMTIGPDLWGTQMYLIRRAWAAECIARFGVVREEIVTSQIRTAELITREATRGLAAYPPLAIEDLTGSIINPEQSGISGHPDVVNCWGSEWYIT